MSGVTLLFPPRVPVGAVKVTQSHLVPRGHACCARDGKPIWYGTLHQPYDGDDFNELLMHADDIAEMERCIAEGSRA